MATNKIDKPSLSAVNERIEYYRKLLLGLSESDKDDQKRKSYTSLLNYWEKYKDKNYKALQQDEKKRKEKRKILQSGYSANHYRKANGISEKSLTIPILTEKKRISIMRYSILNNQDNIEKISQALSLPVILVNKSFNLYEKKGYPLTRSIDQKGVFFLLSKSTDQEKILQATSEENVLISKQPIKILERNFLKFLGFEVL